MDFWVRPVSPIHAPMIRCAIILALYKEEERVRCALPVVKVIAFRINLVGARGNVITYFTYLKTACLKDKYISIATVLDPYGVLAYRTYTFDPPNFSLPTPFKDNFLKK